MDNFEIAIAFTLKMEGTYSNHSQDIGGETMFGITEKVARRYKYTGAMVDLPLQLAKDIYKKDYWLAGKCNIMPLKLGVSVMDACVNHGVRRGTLMLQEALGCSIDGDFGPTTTKLSMIADEDDVARYLATRRKFYQLIVDNHPLQVIFLQGWNSRVDQLETYLSKL